MTQFAGFPRRDLLVGVAAMGALALTQPAKAFDKNAPKIPLPDLLAPDALPDVWLGKADAPITIIEYASVTCPHCANFHLDIYPKLVKSYIDTGKARFALREYPRNPLDIAAFMLARNAGEKRTAIIDLLFKEQNYWAFGDKPADALQGVVKKAGINEEAFKKCLSDQDLFQKVLAVGKRSSEKFGVDATPTFFINGDRLTYWPQDQFDKVLAPYLGKK